MSSILWGLSLLFVVIVAVYSPEPRAGANDVSPQTTGAESKREATGLLFDSFATAAPFVGTLGFADSAGSYTVRALMGVTVDLFPVHDSFEEGRPIAYGFKTGLSYAPIQSGAYALLLPIAFKGTGRFAEHLWIEGTLGAELLFRSVNSSMIVGRGPSDGGNSIEPFPSLGVTVDWKLGPKVALSVRGEFIPTPAADMFSVAVGAVFPAA